MTVLLSVQGLTKGYGPRPLFPGLSLDLRARERVGLLGPNGSGKSPRRRLLAARGVPAPRPGVALAGEPAKHLDLPGIVGLGRLLRGAPFGCLAATHGRALLRAVADEVIAVNRIYPGGCFRAPGSYDEFDERRAAFL